MMNPKKIIIGLVGHPSCGKDTVADYLVEKYGFVHISTGDLVRNHIKENNLGEPARQLMAQVSADLRNKHGGGYLIEKALESSALKLIVSGMRAVAEVEALNQVQAKILAVTAPIELRYGWAKARGRVGENITLPQFINMNAKDSNSADPMAQNMDAVVSLADYTIINNSSLEDLYTQVDKIMLQLPHA